MSYELAKELKDTGFPQMGDGFILLLGNPELVEDPEDQTMSRIERSKYVMLGKYNRYGEDVYEPTISELIEACGDKFHTLGRSPDRLWWAAEFKDSAIFEDTYPLRVGGNSPEEAVARLWLALNKK